MTTSFPNPERQYVDGQVRVAVDLAGGVIRLRATGTGVGTAVDLSVVGAQRVATMLGAVITEAIHRGLPGGSSAR